jgi:hypothetical protein
MYGHVLQASSCTNEWRTAFGIISNDEDPEPQKVHARLEIEAFWAWYYRISLNFRTLVILLQVDPAFGDEPETVYEGCYETKDTSIFTWSSIPGVGHYRWLHSSIHQLILNNKANYLIRTIRSILNYIQLWTITMA